MTFAEARAVLAGCPWPELRFEETLRHIARFPGPTHATTSCVALTKAGIIFAPHGQRGVASRVVPEGESYPVALLPATPFLVRKALWLAACQLVVLRWPRGQAVAEPPYRRLVCWQAWEATLELGADGDRLKLSHAYRLEAMTEVEEQAALLLEPATAPLHTAAPTSAPAAAD